MYIRQIFLIQMEYCLQSRYNHIVGRAASVVSPFYFILLGFYLALKTRRRHKINFEFIGNSKNSIFVYKVPCLIHNSTMLDLQWYHAWFTTVPCLIYNGTTPDSQQYHAWFTMVPCLIHNSTMLDLQQYQFNLFYFCCRS